jgi:hypothetical protein
MQVLGASTTEEKGGCGRRNTAKDTRGTTGHRIDAASETLEREEKHVTIFYNGAFLIIRILVAFNMNIEVCNCFPRRTSFAVTHLLNIC